MANYSYTIPDGEHKGATLWSGRYCCVVGIVILQTRESCYILANKRGPNTLNEQGKWNLPCGFLEDDETGEQGIAREVLEETGISINPDKFFFEEVQTDPSVDKHVVLRYSTLLVLDNAIDYIDQFTTHVTEKDIQFSDCLKASELGEVDACKWVSNVDGLDWAFNHKEIAKEMLEYVNWDIR